MHHIKDLFLKNQSENAHKKFVRYSRGIFCGTLLRIRVSKTNIALNSSFHLCDEILDLIAKKIGMRKIEVKGTITKGCDLTNELEKLGVCVLKVSKNRGICTHLFSGEVCFEKFVSSVFMYKPLLNFETDEISYVTKSSYPKPNKEVKFDFCKVRLPLLMKKEIFENFLFDVKKDFKEILLTHKIEIEDIEMPKNCDFENAREFAKRKGTLTRKVEIKGETEIESEIDFCV